MTTHAIIRHHIRYHSRLTHRVPRKLIGEAVAVGLVLFLFGWLGCR